MAIEVNETVYYEAAEICREIGIVRQTLWRWRRAGKIPSGWRYRDRHVLFSRQEAVAIRDYANRMKSLEVHPGSNGTGRDRQEQVETQTTQSRVYRRERRA